jgi:hypothetical protein
VRWLDGRIDECPGNAEVTLAEGEGDRRFRYQTRIDKLLRPIGEWGRVKFAGRPNYVFDKQEKKLVLESFPEFLGETADEVRQKIEDFMDEWIASREPE